MKILHLSTWDISEGAARGAYWLHKALQLSGIDSYMLVNIKNSDDWSVFQNQPRNKLSRRFKNYRPYADYKVLNRHKDNASNLFTPAIVFSPASWSPSYIHHQINTIKPDIINLHWINKSYLIPEDLLKFRKPLVWTLRDMWAFTGGCHYSDDCNSYLQNCGKCPKLSSNHEKDLSRKLWNRKHKSWKNLNLTLVTISQWLAECTRQSGLFNKRRIKVIHNALDITKFRPMPKSVVRDLLNLDQDNKIILFGAINATSDARKGFEYIKLALQHLASKGLNQTTEVIIFGSSEPKNIPDYGFKVTYLGKLHDDLTLASAYSAADVMLVPSIQEAFGKTAIEALACGTPVVCFDSTGLKDIVDHHQNGYRAECFSSVDLATGISWVLENDERWRKLSANSRNKVEQCFSLDKQVKSYMKLYQEVLKYTR